MAFALRLALLTSAAATAAAATCPDSDWQEFFGMCYWRSSFSTPWTSVASACGALFPGAQPAIVHDFTTNSFLADRVMHGQEAWLGLCCEGDCRDVDDFAWLDGSPVDWELWDDHDIHGLNGSSCASINVVPTGWWDPDVSGNTAYPLLCQIGATQ